MKRLETVIPETEQDLIGVAIRLYRHELKLRQADMAKRLGVTQGFLSRVESGVGMSGARLLKLIRAHPRLEGLMLLTKLGKPVTFEL